MSRWFGLLGAVLAAALVLSMTGCSASVDADGNVLSSRVWFDQAGGAHCPKCDPVVKLKCGADDPASLVKPHQNVCAQDARHPVVWAAENVNCSKCGGSGVCPDCRGAGVTAAGKSCPGCVEFDEDGRPTGSGRCVQCRGKGLLRYGGTGDFGS
jgi:hypothetical protein